MTQNSNIVKCIFFFLCIATITRAFDPYVQKSFQSDFTIEYSKGSRLNGNIYFDNNQDSLRVDYSVLSKTQSNSLAVTKISHYYDLFEKSVFEVGVGECTKYTFDSPAIPVKIPANARKLDGSESVWTAEVTISNLEKKVEWHVNNDGYIEMIKIMSDWGLDATVQFKNIKELSMTLSAPRTSLDVINTDQLYCDRITEKFSSQIKSCPRSCSLRGECIDGECYCFHGFGGKDCSILPEEVPTGICGNGIVEAGEECDDGNLVNDDCCSRDCKIQRVGHTCISGNPCRMPFGTCSAQGVCESEIDENGQCSDGNECTIDTCVNGECVSTPKEMDCPDMACNEYYGCDPRTGNCLYKPKDDGSKCEGSDPCSGYCMNGKCVDNPFQCGSRLCYESYCDAKTGECYQEQLKDGTPCLTIDGCKLVCQSGICMMTDSTCPQLPVSRETELVLIVHPENSFRMAAAELLSRWESSSKSKVAIIDSDVSTFIQFNDVQRSLQQVRSSNYVREVGNNFLNEALERTVGLLNDNVEGEVARAVIVLYPVTESDENVLSNKVEELKKKSAELFIISSAPKVESIRSMFSLLEEKHYIAGLQNDEEAVSRIMDLISAYPVAKRQASCGNGIVEEGEECDDPNDLCCVDCQWLTCPNEGCRGNGQCVNGVCEYGSLFCEYLNTDCTRYICDNDQCIGFNVDEPCDDGNPCTYDDTCSNGVCVGTPVDCSSLDDECVQGSCSLRNGECFEIYLNGTSCANGLCVLGQCAPLNPEFPDCDPLSDTSGLDGICCYAGTNDEIYDCVDPNLYDVDCVLLSWCRSGVCEVELDPICLNRKK